MVGITVVGSTVMVRVSVLMEVVGNGLQEELVLETGGGMVDVRSRLTGHHPHHLLLAGLLIALQVLVGLLLAVIVGPLVALGLLPSLPRGSLLDGLMATMSKLTLVITTLRTGTSPRTVASLPTTRLNLRWCLLGVMQ